MYIHLDSGDLFQEQHELLIDLYPSGEKVTANGDSRPLLV